MTRAEASQELGRILYTLDVLLETLRRGDVALSRDVALQTAIEANRAALRVLDQQDAEGQP